MDCSTRFSITFKAATDQETYTARVEKDFNSVEECKQAVRRFIRKNCLGFNNFIADLFVPSNTRFDQRLIQDLKLVAHPVVALFCPSTYEVAKQINHLAIKIIIGTITAITDLVTLPIRLLTLIPRVIQQHLFQNPAVFKPKPKEFRGTALQWQISNNQAVKNPNLHFAELSCAIIQDNGEKRATLTQYAIDYTHQIQLLV